jgi:hypothetical protein
MALQVCCPNEAVVEAKEIDAAGQDEDAAVVTKDIAAGSEDE